MLAGECQRTILPFLVDADDEVTLLNLVARKPQFLGRVQLPQYQGVALPAEELFDQDGLVLLVDDDIAAAGRWLERVHVQQPALLVARFHAVADHVDRVGAADAVEIGRARRVADRAIGEEHLLIGAAARGAADRDRLDTPRPRRNGGAPFPPGGPPPGPPKGGPGPG